MMGGVEHSTFKETYLADAEEQVKDAIAQTEGRKFILTPGCSVKTNTYVRQLDNLRDAVRKWGPMAEE
jgi:uroporphyrinogen-III decarboxylase